MGIHPVFNVEDLMSYYESPDPPTADTHLHGDSSSLVSSTAPPIAPGSTTREMSDESITEFRSHQLVPTSDGPRCRYLGGNDVLAVLTFQKNVQQSLASSRCFLPFLQSLLAMNNVGDQQKSETLPLVVSLTSLLEELCLVRDEKTAVNPRRVMVALTEYIHGFNLTRQQDAAEAFSHVLSSLEKEISQHYIHLQHGGSLADITAFFSRVYSQEKGAPNEFEKWQKLLHGPFDGILGSYLTCQTCSSMLSADVEFFRSLPLSPVLDEHAKIMEGCSVLDCLEHFTEVERVDSYRCSRCWHRSALKHLSCGTQKDEVKMKKLSHCVKLDSCECKNLLSNEGIPWTGPSHTLKKLSIIKFPKVVSFHLQRSSMNWHGEFIKLEGQISFPLSLDLSPYTEGAANFGQLNSVNFMHSFIPRIGHLLEQQNVQNLPHLYRIVADKPLATSVLENKFKVPFGGLLGSKLMEATAGDSSKKVLIHHFPTNHRYLCSIVTYALSCQVEISSLRSSKSCMYHLCSVVEHYGRPGSGHYAVYRKVASQLSSGTAGEIRDFVDGSWVYISDSNVRRVSEEDVLSAEASMLFYEKFDADP
ncbi:Ubiquitin carboxyl-terminal hydrolase 27 [Platanthera zijinensis]|uniref:ubiquitinyl hydrolase 1 n=1 Tax=Platanthera zijinensis TaxID=2320716 RepID=A0AAP0BXD7_9ASPA